MNLIKLSVFWDLTATLLMSHLTFIKIIHSVDDFVPRRVWRYQRGNQNT